MAFFLMSLIYIFTTEFLGTMFVLNLTVTGKQPIYSSNLSLALSLNKHLDVLWHTRSLSPVAAILTDTGDKNNSKQYSYNSLSVQPLHSLIWGQCTIIFAMEPMEPLVLLF